MLSYSHWATTVADLIPRAIQLKAKFKLCYCLNLMNNVFVLIVFAKGDGVELQNPELILSCRLERQSKSIRIAQLK